MCAQTAKIIFLSATYVKSRANTMELSTTRRKIIWINRVLVFCVSLRNLQMMVMMILLSRRIHQPTKKPKNQSKMPRGKMKLLNVRQQTVQSFITLNAFSRLMAIRNSSTLTRSCFISGAVCIIASSVATAVKLWLLLSVFGVLEHSILGVWIRKK